MSEIMKLISKHTDIEKKGLILCFDVKGYKPIIELFISKYNDYIVYAYGMKIGEEYKIFANPGGEVTKIEKKN